MAVEPSALRVRVCAHDDNGGQLEPSCTQDQIGASSDVTLPLNRKTSWDNKTRSVTKDAIATAVEQTPLLSISAGMPAQVTNKRHKSTASATDIVQS